jgi:hypothetical protein
VFSAVLSWRTSRLRTFPDCAKIKAFNRKVRQGSAKLAKQIRDITDSANWAQKFPRRSALFPETMMPDLA